MTENNNKSKLDELMEADRVLFVRDIDEIPDLILISDTQEIDSTGDMIGVPDLSEEFSCLFVEILDGDLGYVLGVSQCVPHLSYRLYDVDQYMESARYLLEREIVFPECPLCTGKGDIVGSLGSISCYRCLDCDHRYSNRSLKNG